MCRFKYDAQVVQCALFPHLHQESIVNPPPSKRRKLDVGRETQVNGDAEVDSADELRRGIVLESSKETFLVTQSVHEGKTRYTLSVLGPPSPNVPRPRPSTSLMPPADTASKTQDTDTPRTSLPEPSEERKTTTDDPPLSGVRFDPPDSGPKEKETNPSKPPSSHASPKPTIRVLRSNLVDGDFSFEKDVIVVKGDDGKMVIDGDGKGDALEMRVLRWRWYSD